MNKFVISAIIVAIASVGCGKKETVEITGPDGSKVSTSPDGTSMTVTDKDGKTATVDSDGKGGLTIDDGKGGTMQLGTAKVSEDELGVPFYPGSIEPETSMSSKVENDKEKMVTSIRTSKDAPAKVVDFYHDKVKSPAKSSVAGGTMQTASLQGQLEDGADISVAATKDGDQETQILITVTRKK